MNDGYLMVINYDGWLVCKTWQWCLVKDVATWCR